MLLINYIKSRNFFSASFFIVFILSSISLFPQILMLGVLQWIIDQFLCIFIIIQLEFLDSSVSQIHYVFLLKLVVNSSISQVCYVFSFKLFVKSSVSQIRCVFLLKLLLSIHQLVRFAMCFRSNFLWNHLLVRFAVCFC